jgi:uncharacterized protein (UPF0548 family)
MRWRLVREAGVVALAVRTRTWIVASHDDDRGCCEPGDEYSDDDERDDHRDATLSNAIRFITVSILATTDARDGRNATNATITANCSGRITVTSPDLVAWPPTKPEFRRSEVAAVIGAGEQTWRRAYRDVLLWRVKTRSGFSVSTIEPVSVGDRPTITARPFGIRIVEPVVVVAVINESDRVGFAYRTLPGHPVSGEEAFIVSRDGDHVRLTIRSLTRAAPQQPWRILYPLLRVAQVIARRRYLRALR